jgi:hypothetical protein
MLKVAVSSETSTYSYQTPVFKINLGFSVTKSTSFIESIIFCFYYYYYYYGSAALCLAFIDSFSFLILYTVGAIPWTGDQPIARPLPTRRTTQTQNKRTQTSMPRVGFQHTIPVLEREKTVHVLHSAATMISIAFIEIKINF